MLAERQQLRLTGTQTGPEDLVAISNGKWVIASAMSGSGGLAAVSVNDHRVTKIYPAADAKQARDDRLYKDCPGPPNAEKFTTHGLYLFSGGGPVERLLAVGHGERESIEMFNVDIRGDMPQVTWVGCVIAPEADRPEFRARPAEQAASSRPISCRAAAARMRARR